VQLRSNGNPMDTFDKSTSPIDLTVLSRNVSRLSGLLTRDREALPAAYLKDPDLRQAYLRYFVPANISKIHLPLRELSLHPKGLLRKDRLKVLDLGSGPGTALLGMMEFFSHHDHKPVLDCTALDQVGENLKDAERLFTEWRENTGMDASLRTLRSGVDRAAARLAGERFDVLILSNVLNELFHGNDERTEVRRNFLLGLLNQLMDQQGSCIIIEPALRETSREMLEVVCGLPAQTAQFYAPCPASGLCATLENARDWQHEEVPWDPPEIVREVDQRIGLRKDALKFSYVVLRKDASSITDVLGLDAWRVVSEPLISKGKAEFYLCGSEGRRLVVRLDKDWSDLNQDFGGLQRGAFVGFDGVLDEGKRLKVVKETKVIVKKV